MNRRNLIRAIVGFIAAPLAVISRTSIYDIARRGGSILIERYWYRVGTKDGYVHYTKIGSRK